MLNPGQWQQHLKTLPLLLIGDTNLVLCSTTATTVALVLLRDADTA